MADHIPSICEFAGCLQDSVFRCATCDLGTCEEHHDHGPVGNGPHLAARSDAARIHELTTQLAERDAEIATLRARVEELTNAADRLMLVLQHVDNQDRDELNAMDSGADEFRAIVWPKPPADTGEEGKG